MTLEKKEELEVGSSFFWKGFHFVIHKRVEFVSATRHQLFTLDLQ